MRLFSAELTKAFHIFRREWVTFLIGNGLLVLFFFAFNSVLGSAAPDSAAIAGDTPAKLYFLWIVMANGFLAVAGDFEKDIQHGVIERIFISGTSLWHIVFFRSLVGLAHTAVVGAVVGAILLLTSSEPFSFTLEFFVALVAAVFTGVGLGFVAVGIVFVVRPSALVLMPAQLALLGVLSAMTIVGGNNDILSILVPGGPAVAGMVTPSQISYTAIIVNVGVYFALGLWALKVLEAYARRSGSISK